MKKKYELTDETIKVSDVVLDLFQQGFNQLDDEEKPFIIFYPDADCYCQQFGRMSR